MLPDAFSAKLWHFLFPLLESHNEVLCMHDVVEWIKGITQGFSNFTANARGLILLIWINFNPAMDTVHMLSKMWDEITRVLGSDIGDPYSGRIYPIRFGM